MSGGKLDKLAHMANQIGDAHASWAPEEAAQAVATHIQKFWTPKMIAETLQALAAQNVKLNVTAAASFAILKQTHAQAS